VLHQFGIDHQKLVYQHAGRNRLVDGQPARGSGARLGTPEFDFMANRIYYRCLHDMLPPEVAAFYTYRRDNALLRFDAGEQSKGIFVRTWCRLIQMTESMRRSFGDASVAYQRDSWALPNSSTGVHTIHSR
jgi:hypothetical protein